MFFILSKDFRMVFYCRAEQAAAGVLHPQAYFKNKKICKGFTLVELLMASTIFAVVMAGLYSAFRTGIFSYGRIDESISLSQEAAQILDRMNLDIRNSLPYAQEEPRFMGLAQNMSFFTLADVYDNENLVRLMARVTYSLANHQLLRSCLTNTDALNENAEPKPEEMASNIEEFSLSYGFLDKDAKTILWQEAMQVLPSWPLAVKVKLTLKEKTQMEFERTIFTPVAAYENKT